MQQLIVPLDPSHVLPGNTEHIFLLSFKLHDRHTLTRGLKTYLCSHLKSSVLFAQRKPESLDGQTDSLLHVASEKAGGAWGENQHFKV